MSLGHHGYRDMHDNEKNLLLYTLKVLIYTANIHTIFKWKYDKSRIF